MAAPMSERGIAVIGGGAMGVGIAHAFVTAGTAVELVDADRARAEAAANAVEHVLSGAVERGKLDAAAARAARARLVPRGAIAELTPGLALIVEAVPEIPDLKRRVLAEAEARRPAILATNTSGIAIGELAESLAAPEHFIGMHFFNPVWAMALLEVVVGDRTDAPTLAAALAFGKHIGKETIVVRDQPGFASTRLGIALGLEAMRMVEDGVASPADIDRAMEIGYRHPMGPLKLTDLVGLDVRLDIARNLARTYGARYAPPAILERMVAAGEVGKKSGRGFYRWTERGPEPLA
jgi:3-hydroxybutyryl-CoA dehydrogenase